MSTAAACINRVAHTLLSEQGITDILNKQFGEEFVHNQHTFFKGSMRRLDNFVYTQDGNFAVDVAYCGGKAQNRISLKLRQYGDWNCEEVLYLVMWCEEPDLYQEHGKVIVCSQYNFKRLVETRRRWYLATKEV